jgi:hypothetical protein
MHFVYSIILTRQKIIDKSLEIIETVSHNGGVEALVPLSEET